jgi:hypothetical protein
MEAGDSMSRVHHDSLQLNARHVFVVPAPFFTKSWIPKTHDF